MTNVRSWLRDPWNIAQVVLMIILIGGFAGAVALDGGPSAGASTLLPALGWMAVGHAVAIRLYAKRRISATLLAIAIGVSWGAALPIYLVRVAPR